MCGGKAGREGEGDGEETERGGAGMSRGGIRSKGGVARRGEQYETRHGGEKQKREG